MTAAKRVPSFGIGGQDNAALSRPTLDKGLTIVRATRDAMLANRSDWYALGVEESAQLGSNFGEEDIVRFDGTDFRERRGTAVGNNLAAGHALSATVQPYNRTTVQPYNRTTVQPYNRTTVQPYNRTTVQPCNRATEILAPPMTFLTDMRNHIDFARIEANLPTLRQQFQTAHPFPHVVIDGFLREASLRALLREIPPPALHNKSSDYVFAKNKFENPTFAAAAPLLADLREELLGDRFARVLSTVYGKPLFVDPQFVGGGIHQGGEGSFLDMHADFSRHPVSKEWLRELNILLYLNEDYEASFGGHLELEHAQTHVRGQVAPILNRLVLMLTKAHTLHGYRPIRFPPGRYRTSIAAYAYSLNTDFDAQPQRSTMWTPEGRNPLKHAFARMSPMLVRVKNSLFGSSTAKRAGAGKRPKSR